MKKDKLLRMARHLEVSAYVPPPHEIFAARDRTDEMVTYFMYATANLSHGKYMNALQNLARSCYLQGAHDTANKAAEMVMRGELHA